MIRRVVVSMVLSYSLADDVIISLDGSSASAVVTTLIAIQSTYKTCWPSIQRPVLLAAT